MATEIIPVSSYFEFDAIREYNGSNIQLSTFIIVKVPMSNFHEREALKDAIMLSPEAKFLKRHAYELFFLNESNHFFIICGYIHPKYLTLYQLTYGNTT